MSYDIFGHWRKVNELLASSTAFATVTLVDIRGSAPQIQGAKAIVTQDGIEFGTVGGGKIEAQAVRHAVDMLGSQDSKACDFVVWNLQTDVGMTCGGEVKLLFEVSNGNEWKIAVFGAGHIAQCLVPVLLGMHCRVTWIDQRPEWLERIADHPKLKKICSPKLEQEVANLDPRSFFVLMTQGHATDLPVLAEILKTLDPPYVGVLGSKQKAKVLQRNLQEMNVSDQKIASYYCPMGMPIGNNTPPEIAISVVSQLIQERDRLGIVQQKTKRF